MRCIGVAVSSIRQRYEGRKGKGKMAETSLADKADGLALRECSPLQKDMAQPKKKDESC